MKVTWKKHGATLRLRFSGELDHHSAADVRREIDGLLSDTAIGFIVFDLGGVTFMDSSGIGVILGRYRMIAARGGGMDIINASRQIERILRMAGVYTLCTQGGTVE